MVWIQPPPDVRRRVEQALGDRIWEQLQDSFSRVLLVDPNMRMTQWYRSPAEIRKEFSTNPRAAWFTQHGLGLAVDATPTEAKRAQVIAAARAAGFHVGTYRTSRQLHMSALTPDAWARSPLQSYLRSIIGPRPTRGARRPTSIVGEYSIVDLITGKVRPR